MSTVMLRRQTVEWKSNGLTTFGDTARITGAWRGPVPGSTQVVRLSQRKDTFQCNQTRNIRQPKCAEDQSKIQSRREERQRPPENDTRKG